MVLPGMSDGRMFTDYSSNCEYNKNLMRTYAKQTSNEYREYLQTHGDQIMKTLAEQSKEKAKIVGF